MSPLGVIIGVMGTLLMFGFAAWMGPRVIKAMYPEDMHDQMLRMHKIMVGVAIVMVFLAVFSVLFFALQR